MIWIWLKILCLIFQDRLMTVAGPHSGPAWQGLLLSPPVALPLLEPLKCPQANSCWRRRRAWQGQEAPPVSPWCQLQQLVTRLGEGQRDGKTKTRVGGRGSHGDRAGDRGRGEEWRWGEACSAAFAWGASLLWGICWNHLAPVKSGGLTQKWKWTIILFEKYGHLGSILKSSDPAIPSRVWNLVTFTDSTRGKQTTRRLQAGRWSSTWCSPQVGRTSQEAPASDSHAEGLGGKPHSQGQHHSWGAVWADLGSSGSPAQSPRILLPLLFR